MATSNIGALAPSTSEMVGSAEVSMTTDSEKPTDLKATSKKKKKTKLAGFRKAPQAPRRFKSPYILFSISKMAEYKQSTDNIQVTSISRRIAEDWRTLPEVERKKWDAVALQDKLRYNAEKRLYTGPWKVPSKRSRKDPSAPKRPASAFLFFCQTQRKLLQLANPNMKNTEISKLLGEQWKNAPAHVRQPHIDREQRERESYKSRIAEWREQRQKQEEFAKQQRLAVAEQYVQSGGLSLPTPAPQGAELPSWGNSSLPSMIMPLQPSFGSPTPGYQTSNGEYSPALAPFSQPFAPQDAIQSSYHVATTQPEQVLSPSHNPPLVAPLSAPTTNYNALLAAAEQQFPTMSPDCDSAEASNENQWFPQLLSGDTSFDLPLLEVPQDVEGGCE